MQSSALIQELYPRDVIPYIVETCVMITRLNLKNITSTCNAKFDVTTVHLLFSTDYVKIRTESFGCVHE